MRRPESRAERLHKHIIRDNVLFPIARQYEKARQALEDAKKCAKEQHNG